MSQSLPLLFALGLQVGGGRFSRETVALGGEELQMHLYFPQAVDNMRAA